jgi:hypothetical protein
METDAHHWIPPSDPKTGMVAPNGPDMDEVHEDEPSLGTGDPDPHVRQ